ncbi:MAG: lysophospholipid acyltransferase family protein [Paludibacteraceae bacterium]
MKYIYPLYFIYQWLVAIPLMLLSTFFTTTSIIILSPIFPNSKLANLPAVIWGKFCCYVFFINIKTVGFERLDKKQSYIFTANHQSMFDILVVYGWIPFIFKWIMKMELRKVPFIGAASAAAGHIFVDRSNPIAAKHSMEKAAEQLKNGNSVVIFPEGTRTKTGKLGKFKRGAFLLAMELKLPIVPVTISGSYERIKGLRVFPGTITLTVHPPLDVTQYDMSQSSELLRTTQEIVRSGL